MQSQVFRTDAILSGSNKNTLRYQQCFTYLLNTILHAKIFDVETHFDELLPASLKTYDCQCGYKEKIEISNKSISSERVNVQVGYLATSTMGPFQLIGPIDLMLTFKVKLSYKARYFKFVRFQNKKVYVSDYKSYCCSNCNKSGRCNKHIDLCIKKPDLSTVTERIPIPTGDYDVIFYDFIVSNSDWNMLCNISGKGIAPLAVHPSGLREVRMSLLLARKFITKGGSFYDCAENAKELSKSDIENKYFKFKYEDGDTINIECGIKEPVEQNLECTLTVKVPCFVFPERISICDVFTILNAYATSGDSGTRGFFHVVFGYGLTAYEEYVIKVSSLKFKYYELFETEEMPTNENGEMIV
jgi:hypothetical protein